MAANLNRKEVALGTGQSLLNFGTIKKKEVFYVEREVELRAPLFKAEVLKIEVQTKRREQRLESKHQLKLSRSQKNSNQLKNQRFQCNDCQNFFSTKQTLKRHVNEIHSGKTKIYFKFDKVDGRYQCTTCMKSNTHSANVKRHIEKHHLSKFLLQDQETQKLIPAKRKSNTLESQRELQRLTKEAEKI